MHYDEYCISMIYTFLLKEHVMASLQVRELPENIYSLLKRRAEAKHRSIAQEAVDAYLCPKFSGSYSALC